MVWSKQLSVGNVAAFAALGGIACIAFERYARLNMADKIERQPYCRETLELLKNHRGANYVLGTGFTVKVYILWYIIILRLL